MPKQLPRLVLAPLLGITTASFRRVFLGTYPGWTGAVAPFIATTSGNESKPRRFKDIFPHKNPWHPLRGLLEPQLIGKVGSDFAQNAQRIKDEWGYGRINWNIGCPSGTVTAKSRGAGLLPFPDEIDRFLDTACSQFDGSITVKMRLGMYAETEWEALVPVLNRYPLGEITVHGRTGQQQYKGRANFAESARLMSQLKAPVLYNGDINSLDFALWILEQYPSISGLMIGRGALTNPLLAQEITMALAHGRHSTLAQVLPDGLAPRTIPWTSLDKDEQRRYHGLLVQELEAEAAEAPGAQLLLGPMKELWSHWVPWFMDPKANGADRDKAERIVSRILKAKNPSEYFSAVDRAWSNRP